MWMWFSHIFLYFQCQMKTVRLAATIIKSQVAVTDKPIKIFGHNWKHSQSYAQLWGTILWIWRREAHRQPCGQSRGCTFTVPATSVANVHRSFALTCLSYHCLRWHTTIYAPTQVCLDSRTLLHTHDKLTFQSKGNRSVRCEADRLLLVDGHIKHSHKGRIWRIFHGTLTTHLQVCLSLPASGERMTGSRLNRVGSRQRFTLKFMWECVWVLQAAGL